MAFGLDPMACILVSPTIANSVVSRSAKSSHKSCKLVGSRGSRSSWASHGNRTCAGAEGHISGSSEISYLRGRNLYRDISVYPIRPASVGRPGSTHTLGGMRVESPRLATKLILSVGGAVAVGKGG